MANENEELVSLLEDHDRWVFGSKSSVNIICYLCGTCIYAPAIYSVHVLV